MTIKKKELVSVIIRTLNEEKYLPELMSMVRKQLSNDFEVEIVIVDSGSTDKTLDIAKSHNARITSIQKENFSFGRSLNVGCEFADGKYLVFISGHCIPTDESWVQNLVLPIKEGICHYTYGRQEARDTTKFSERQLFSKYFPKTSQIPQDGFFCNNANAALPKSVWKKYKFDEKLTGCEDMELAKRICSNGGNIGYVSEASVFHIHDETWQQVKTRYEREAFALQKILPEVHITKFDALKFFIAGVAKDMRLAFLSQVFIGNFSSIIMFRWAQYYGAYVGNHSVRELSRKVKDRYFYPRVKNMAIKEKYDD
jgi:glycosyltransferase involved in cell wall biosynthesis